MRKLLQVDFNLAGPFSAEMEEAMVNLAQSINNEPGMVWKIWTQEPASQLGGGIYLFEDEHTARNYLDMHSARLTAMGISNIRGVIFDINQALTRINNGPINL